MGLFGRRVDHLLAVLEARGGGFSPPASFLDQIVFTFPLFGSSRWGEMTVNIATTGAAGVTNVDTSLVPNGSVGYFLGFSMSHNDPVSRAAQILIVDNATGAGVVLEHAQGITTTEFIALKRPVLVPPNCLMRAAVPLLAAAQTITIRGIAINLPLGEEIFSV